MNSINKFDKRRFVCCVADFATAHKLFETNAVYIVGLSGGADSVALLHVMLEMSRTFGFCVEAVHCNFHLRGEESLRDELFCKALCEKLKIPLHLVHFDTTEYAMLHHVSIEMAARDLRYQYFESLRKDIGADKICVAHHRDDSVETVILNLVRGTGIRGLRGIQPISGFVARPLLSVSRNDIICYLNAIGQDYVTDSTNLINDVKRNKIRLDIIPLLKELNPSVQRSIFETSLRIGEALKVYDHTIDMAIGNLVGRENEVKNVNVPINISVEKLLAMPSPESVLFAILEKRGYKSAQISQIMKATGRQNGYFASRSHELIFDRGCIIVQPIDYNVNVRILCIPETGIYIYAEEIKIMVKFGGDSVYEKIPKDCNCAYLDASKLKFPLYMRPVRKGDRFKPFGMDKFKLLSDYLTDRKFSIFDKRRQLVVTDSDGHIVWLVGERVDNRYSVSTATKTVVTIRRL